MFCEFRPRQPKPVCQISGITRAVFSIRGHVENIPFSSVCSNQPFQERGRGGDIGSLIVSLSSPPGVQFYNIGIGDRDEVNLSSILQGKCISSPDFFGNAHRRWAFFVQFLPG